ncbi:MAG: hypothetical protein OHK0017_02550 [Patescibacteria group bacterium]
MNGLLERYQGMSQGQKILFWVVTVILLVAIIFGIAQLFNKPVARVVVDNTPVTLTWRKPFYTQNDYQDIINDFRKIYPNISIELETVSQAEFGDGIPYYQRLVSDFAIDNPPDIFSISNSDLAAVSQFMTPIDYYKGDALAKYKEDFVDVAVAETMQLNKVYAITSYVDNLQMYYNKDILQQSGIAIPAKNWEEVKIQAKILNRRDTRNNFVQHAIGMGTAMPGNNPRGKDIIPTLIMQNRGVIYDRQSGSVGLGQPRSADLSNLAKTTAGDFKLTDTKDNPTLDAIRFYADFANPTSDLYSWNRDSENTEDSFIGGKTAYLIGYSYLKDVIEARNPNLKFETTTLPQLNENYKKTMANFFMDGMGKHLSEPANASKRKAAEAFLVFLASKESQTKFTSKTRTPPARKDIIADIKSQNSNIYIRTFADGSLYADNYYRPTMCTDRIWIDMLDNYQTKGTDLNSTITEAVNRYRTLVSIGPKIVTTC